MFNTLKRPLALQLIHIGLSTLWNIAGVILISRNLQALGPTASINVVVLLLVLGALLIFGASRFKYLYLLVSAVLFYGAASAIAPAFYLATDLWPSDFWRFAGVALNLVGIIGAVWGFKTILSTSTRISNENS